MNLDQVVLREPGLRSKPEPTTVGHQRQEAEYKPLPVCCLLLAFLLDVQDMGGYAQTTVSHEALRGLSSSLAMARLRPSHTHLMPRSKTFFERSHR